MSGDSGGAPREALNDAYGFGFFPGQFGMVVYSQLPDRSGDKERTFQLFKWKAHAGEPSFRRRSTRRTKCRSCDSRRRVTGTSRSSSAARPSTSSSPIQRRRSSTARRIGTARRNFDEIRFWADYITPGGSGYIYDDEGAYGGLKPGELFVIAGDQNSDPLDGDSIPGSIQQLLEHPLVNTKTDPRRAPARWKRRHSKGYANTTA